jgi:hypothetical protein
LRWSRIDFVDAVRRAAGGQSLLAPEVTAQVLEVDGDLVRESVARPVDALIKTASRYTVESIAGHEAELEDVFLAYYEACGCRKRVCIW